MVANKDRSLTQRMVMSPPPCGMQYTFAPSGEIASPSGPEPTVVLVIREMGAVVRSIRKILALAFWTLPEGSTPLQITVFVASGVMTTLVGFAIIVIGKSATGGEPTGSSTGKT